MWNSFVGRSFRGSFLNAFFHLFVGFRVWGLGSFNFVWGLGTDQQDSTDHFHGSGHDSKCYELPLVYDDDDAKNIILNLRLNPNQRAPKDLGSYTRPQTGNP